MDDTSHMERLLAYGSRLGCMIINARCRWIHLRGLLSSILLILVRWSHNCLTEHFPVNNPVNNLVIVY